MSSKKKSLSKAKPASAKRSKVEMADTCPGACPQQETDFEESLFESQPSKEFASSTLSCSTSKTLLELSPNRKRSFRKLSIDNSPLIPLNDDSHELIEEEENSEAEPEVLAKKPEPEPEMSIVQTMTLEQMQEHVSRCLQLSTENKINSKNAFALKLIDCMTIMTKNDDESNFAAMACQLDAGAKIYSHRVDAVHQQVIKLVESCMFAEKRDKKKVGEHEDQSEDDDDNTDGKASREKKKKLKKKVLVSNEQISRKPREKDPRDKFVRLEALPGDILEKARREPSNLALSLDNAAPFWPAQSSTHVTDLARGPALVPLPHIVVKNRRLGPELTIDRDSDLDLSTLPRPSTSMDYSSGPDSPDNMIDIEDEHRGDDIEESVAFSQEKAAHPEMEMVVLARSRMTIGGSVDPSQLEVMKALFHQPGESDYHYLKMDNSYYWAGPSYWKRPHGVNVAANRKKVSRKKKEPVAIEYTDKASKEWQKGKGKSNERVMRPTTLSRRVLSKWSKKKVTFPRDIHFELKTFNMLFHLDIMAQVVLHDPDETVADPDADYVMEAGDDVDAADDSIPLRQDTEDMETSGNSGKGEMSGTVGDLAPPSKIQLEEAAGPSTSAAKTASCDVYEGDNLVPMVKMVKVEPIRCVARPNRVDMGHLKEVMLSIIRRNIEDRENEQRQAGSLTPHGNVAFKDVLTELFNSDLVQSRTREDLSIQMCFLCLLTLANEHSLSLKQDVDSGDVIIGYDTT